MPSLRKVRVAAILGSILTGIGFVASPGMADQLPNQSFNATYSIGSGNESPTASNFPVDFDARWNADNDEMIFDADGVIRPYSAQKTDDIQTGSIPVASRNSHQNAGVQKSQYSVKRASTGISLAPECDPSLLSEAEIRDIVVRQAAEFNVDERFALAIVKAESNFDRTRNSPKGARGPMQLMPETASDYGVQDICDPEQNIRGGMAHLRHLFATQSNPLVVAAAYNAGEARIAEYGGIPPFAETLNYVAKVINFELGLDPPNTRLAIRTGSRLNTYKSGPPPALAQNGVTKPAKGQWIAGVLQF